MSGDFTVDQKRYLEGFMSGAQVARAGRAPAAALPPRPSRPARCAEPQGHGAHGSGRQEALPEEKAKREEMGLDAWPRMEEAAREGVYPKGPDILRWKYHGLFYVAPAQDSFMCRLRMPNGILTHWQFRASPTSPKSTAAAMRT